MKNSRLLKIKKFELAPYSLSQEKEIVRLLPSLNFSDKKDICLNSQTAGIAMRITFINNRALMAKPGGVRRPLQLMLTDLYSRRDIPLDDIALCIPKTDYLYVCHAIIPFKDFSFEVGRFYCIDLFDKLKNTWLGEYEFLCKEESETSPLIENPESVSDWISDEWPGLSLERNDEDKDKDGNSASRIFTDALNRLTGLHEVKKKLAAYESLVSFNKKRMDFGLPVVSSPLHAMFLGSPGTGKTTVARMMGEMLNKKGLLSSGHVVVRERANLLGQNYNSEGENTLEAIKEAQGGILFIDEAYQLYQPHDPRDPGKFVIETLLTALSDPSNRDWMLILAGYPAQMKKMWSMNPGFRSRIPESNIYQFDDFSENELMEIAENYLSENKYMLSRSANMALRQRMKTDLINKDESFGNARYVLNLIQTEILPAMAVRIIGEEKVSYEALCEIMAEDIPSCGYVKSEGIRNPIGYKA